MREEATFQTNNSFYFLHFMKQLEIAIKSNLKTGNLLESGPKSGKGNLWFMERIFLFSSFLWCYSVH